MFSDLPPCLDPEADPCEIAEIGLWAINLDAWHAYRAVGGVVHAAVWGPPPLDVAGVIATLDWLGLSPPEPEARAELLDDLTLIHATRLALAQREAETKRKKQVEIGG